MSKGCDRIPNFRNQFDKQFSLSQDWERGQGARADAHQMSSLDLRARPVTLSDDAATDPVEFCYDQGWAADGLPVVPPTPERVETMLTGTGRDPQELLGMVPPRMAKATVEAVAINAVMAGCRPEYLPVILAAVEAMLDDSFNLNGVQSTTHPCAPLMIVSGPVAQRIGVNGKANVFGSGFRANATIGRAIRLILLNLGGGTPDVGDKSVLGHPGKYSFCIAENDADSPWAPFHTDRGFRPEEEVVTVFACDAPQAILGGLFHIGEHLKSPGTNNMQYGGEMLVVLGVQVAQRVAKRGWNKDDVRQYLFEHGRTPLHNLWGKSGTAFTAERGGGEAERWPRWLDLEDGNTLIPAARKPEYIHLMVAGNNAADFCAWLPGWGYMGGQAVSRKVVLKA